MHNHPEILHWNNRADTGTSPCKFLYVYRYLLEICLKTLSLILLPFYITFTFFSYPSSNTKLKKYSCLSENNYCLKSESIPAGPDHHRNILLCINDTKIINYSIFVHDSSSKRSADSTGSWNLIWNFQGINNRGYTHHALTKLMNA